VAAQRREHGQSHQHDGEAGTLMEKDRAYETTDEFIPGISRRTVIFTLGQIYDMHEM
jgi:hypothetical protein